MGKIKRTFGFIANHPLGRRHPFKSMARFVKWQLQSRFLPSIFFVKRFVKPVKFYARKGLSGITGNIYTGLHEFNDMAFLLHFLRPDDVFFDIGANVGSYTLLASGVCRATSITIEPVSSTFDILQRNISLNHLQDKVTALNSAAGAVAGTINFTSDDDTNNHALTNTETNISGIVNVPVLTIDSLTPGKIPDLIKIDVEGYETEVLKGMKRTLKSAELKAIIIELNGSGNRFGYDEEQIHQLLLKNGFKPHTYDPFKRLLTAAGSFGNYNTIYCRDREFIDQRLQQAPAINIMGETF